MANEEEKWCSLCCLIGGYCGQSCAGAWGWYRENEPAPAPAPQAQLVEQVTKVTSA